MFQIETALAGLISNLPFRPVAWLVKPFVLPFGLTQTMPSDALGARVAHALLDGDRRRERLTANIFVPQDDAPGLGLLERAAEAAVAARPAAAKVRKALKAGALEKEPADNQVEKAQKAGLISGSEKSALEHADSTRNRAIQVDWFDVDTYNGLH